MSFRFFLFMLIFGQTCFAQKFSDNLFIELGMSNKIHILRRDNVHSTISTNYYTINQSQYIIPGSVLINANFGYRLINGNEFILGIMQDEVEVGYSAYIPNVQTFTPSLSTGNAISKGYGGVSTKNISLSYKNLIIKHHSSSFKKDNYFGIQFNVGLSYIYKPNNGIENLTGSDGITVTAPDSNKVSVIFTEYVLPVQFKNSFKLNSGLTFLFGKKNKETFAFTVSYVTSRLGSSGSNFFFTRVETVVTDNNNTKDIYKSTYYFRGRGNGLYFTLSKKIFPFKIIHDRQQKKIDKYKNEQINP